MPARVYQAHPLQFSFTFIFAACFNSIFTGMETLIEELKAELNISKEKALEIIKAIADYVEQQHPMLQDLSKDIFEKESKKHTI